jgi:hypothetical protein
VTPVTGEGDGIARIEIEGDFDRHEAEMLRLELQRLAARHGVEVRSLKIEKDPA